jgi:hypothetical protein
MSLKKSWESEIIRQRKQLGDRLSLAIPGIPLKVHIPFAINALPVCGICKGGSRTKTVCRGQLGHTDLPWSDTCICITFDRTCFNQGLLKPNIQFEAEVTNMNIELLFMNTKSKTMPSCVTCKKMKYTRQLCRETFMHRTLPYCTSYVTLKDSSCRILDEVSDRHSVDECGHKMKSCGQTHVSLSYGGNEGISQGPSKSDTDADMTGFMDNINESHSFLCIVSDTSSSFEVSSIPFLDTSLFAGAIVLSFVCSFSVALYRFCS